MQSAIKVSCSSWVSVQLSQLPTLIILNLGCGGPGETIPPPGRTPVIRLASFHRTFLFRRASIHLFPSRMSKAEHVIVWIRLRYQDMKTGGGQDMAGNCKIYGWIWYVLVIYMAGYGKFW